MVTRIDRPSMLCKTFSLPFSPGQLHDRASRTTLTSSSLTPRLPILNRACFVKTMFGFEGGHLVCSMLAFVSCVSEKRIPGVAPAYFQYRRRAQGLEGLRPRTLPLIAPPPLTCHGAPRDEDFFFSSLPRTLYVGASSGSSGYSRLQSRPIEERLKRGRAVLAQAAWLSLVRFIAA